MMLMPAALEVVPEHIGAGDVWIATGVDGEIAGGADMARLDAQLVGQVDEPADPLRIGEPHLPPAPCSSSASWSDIRFYVAVKTRPARDSLIRRKNSLMARINSLQGRIKFPVPMRRELGRKPLNSAIDFEPIVALGGLDEQNSRYSLANGTKNSGIETAAPLTYCLGRGRCGQGAASGGAA